MTIPESQFRIWTNQGPTEASQVTHKSIRSALESYKRWPTSISYNVYLQGSYRNATNIRGDSDVDLVVELTSSVYSNLTVTEKSALEMTATDYGWEEFRADVVSALTEHYGFRLVDTSGSKSIKVLPNSGRLKGDVVVAVSYHHYDNMKLIAEGITFWTLPYKSQIVNYPKLHFENGVDKNSTQHTQDWYKYTIRMYKNARKRIYDIKPHLQGQFPSYFVENLLYNVPDMKFGGSCQSSFLNTLNWLGNELYTSKANEFVCQNGMAYLFGDSSVQWKLPAARNYVEQLAELWNNW